MFQVIDPGKPKDINPNLLIVQADYQELLDNKLKNSPVWTSLKAFHLCRLLNLHAGLWDCLPRSYYETNDRYGRFSMFKKSLTDKQTFNMFS